MDRSDQRRFKWHLSLILAGVTLVGALLLWLGMSYRWGQTVEAMATDEEVEAIADNLREHAEQCDDVIAEGLKELDEEFHDHKEWDIEHTARNEVALESLEKLVREVRDDVKDIKRNGHKDP